MTQITETVEREKRYETDVHSNSDYDMLPFKACFVITEADAQEIIRLSELVTANGLYKVEKFDYRTSWLKEDGPYSVTEVCSDTDELNVSATDFWFTSYLENPNVEIRSSRQCVSELKEWFGIQDKQTVTNTLRVLVVVSGGVADSVSDAGVAVEVFDWDNYRDGPEGTGGVSEHFADLAEPIGVPVGEMSAPTNRPKP